MTDLTVAELGGGDDAIPELYRSGRAKKARAKVFRIAAYILGLALVVALGLATDWEKVSNSYFNADRARALFPDIIKVAARNTVVYTVLAFVGGVVLGLSAALMRLSSIRLYRWLAAIYIEIFRGLPALLTIIFVGYITPIALNIHFPEVMGVPSAGIVALSLVAGAYLAETIRAGIEAVPRGQVEAARSLGLTYSQTLRKIVIPQAFRIVIPPLTNELVLLLKDTALLAALGTRIDQKELTKFARDAGGKGFNGTPLVIAGLLYLAITIPLTRLVAVLEKRNKVSR